MILEQRLFGATFRNPILLASGTCGYGLELNETISLEELGGFVTKSVTPEPRGGNAPVRVAEFKAGMLNSVGLANVGVEAFRREKLPRIAEHARGTRVLVGVAGFTTRAYADLIRALDDEPGFLGYEMNVSCPNVEEGGAVIATRTDLLGTAVRQARDATDRPLVVKLAPNVPDIGAMAEAVARAGADAITLVNTFPGMLFDLTSRRPVLGAGSGGVSGPAVLPMGVHAVWQASRRVDLPVVGVGGVRTSEDALQYLLAGATLVQIGTASFADPRTAGRVINGLARYGREHGIQDVRELVGAGMAGGDDAVSEEAESQ